MNYIYQNLYRNPSFTNGIVWIISYLLSGIFIFSGIAKLLGIHNFVDEVAQYMDYYLNMPVLIEYRKIIATSICVVEVLIGLFSILQIRNILLTAIMMLLLFFFTYLTGRNYFFPAFGHGITSCGCFGDYIYLSAGWSFAKSLFLAILSSIKLYICCHK